MVQRLARPRTAQRIEKRRARQRTKQVALE